MDALAFIIFLVVIWALQGLGKLVEFFAEQQKRAQAEEEERQQRLRGPSSTSTATRQPEARTPFEALVRYMEEQSREQAPPPPPPPPRPSRRPPARVTAAPAPSSERGELAQHHLRSGISDRHMRREAPRRRAPARGLGGRAALTGFRGADVAELGSLEAIEALPPWQKAVVYSELLGQPRAQTPWRPRGGRAS